MPDPLTLWTAFRALPWKLIGYAALGLALAASIIALKLERAHSAKLATQIQSCAAAREADRRSYEQAQKQAAEQNKAEVQRIESEQEKVSAKISSDYSRDLARLRAEFMRNHSASPGSAQSSGAGTVPDASEPFDGTAQVCVPAGDALSSAETELKLFSLQAWIREQLGVKR